jgi:pimeloyl-ACP methyl ester carboxylesterase
MKAPSFHDAVAPERSASVDSFGIRLRIYEWGDPAGIPIVLHHGMFDHARGFDRLAPLLAERFRVVALDARGHGESDWAASYPWAAEVGDLVNLLRWLGRPSHLLGHSMGGGLVIDAAIGAPDRVRGVVNLDGFGPPAEGFEPPNRRPTAATTAPERFAEYLDRQRGASAKLEWRAYASLDELVERRQQQNPRLSREWLRYFVFHGARETQEGWRWKVDPQAAMSFGPWRPDWIGDSYRPLRAPLLAVIGSKPDTWGPLPEDVLEERLQHVTRLERAVVDGAGHFIHMEKPAETADLALDFLADL